MAMAKHADDLGCKLGLPANLLDMLTNLVVVVKLQQLNIELLWQAHDPSKSSEINLQKVRESNLRLTATMEQMVNAIMCKEQLGKLGPH